MRCDQVPNIEQGYRKMLTLSCGHVYAKGDSLPTIGFVCKVCQIPTIQPENLLITNLKNMENRRESIDKNRRESIFDSFIIPINFVKRVLFKGVK